MGLTGLLVQQTMHVQIHTVIARAPSFYYHTMLQITQPLPGILQQDHLDVMAVMAIHPGIIMEIRRQTATQLILNIHVTRVMSIQHQMALQSRLRQVM